MIVPALTAERSRSARAIAKAFRCPFELMIPNTSATPSARIVRLPSAKYVKSVCACALTKRSTLILASLTTSKSAVALTYRVTSPVAVDSIARLL